MNKITPQEFLDLTEFNWIAHSFQKERNYRKSVRVLLSTTNPYHSTVFPEYWNCDDNKDKRRRLTQEEYDSIDWAGFDCSKPLERTR